MKVKPLTFNFQHPSTFNVSMEEGSGNAILYNSMKYKVLLKNILTGFEKKIECDMPDLTPEGASRFADWFWRVGYMSDDFYRADLLADPDWKIKRGNHELDGYIKVTMRDESGNLVFDEIGGTP